MSATVLTTIGVLFSFQHFIVFLLQQSQSMKPVQRMKIPIIHRNPQNVWKEMYFISETGLLSETANSSMFWRPSNPKNSADCIAAHEAARQEAEKKANSLDKLPYVIAVLQDLECNAIGGHSIKGEDAQKKLRKKMYEDLRKALDKIPQTEQGVGHGFCAEIACVHNIEVVRRHQQNRSVADKMFTGTRFTIAYERTKEEKKKKGTSKV